MEAKSATKQRSCVAWFKLAQFIERGERERALGMFRLLTHAVAQQAFTHQLEGDLLLAFANFEQAREQYLKATRLYAQESDYNSAISVYEHMLRNELLVEAMVPVMVQTYADSCMTDRTFNLVQSLVKTDSELLTTVVKNIVEVNAFCQDSAMYCTVALMLVQYSHPALAVAIIALFRHPYFIHDPSQQQSILSTLRLTNERVYNECIALLQNN